ncbi:hypothetical protein RN001_011551 [Aquatica leii]|uniref:Nucleotide exchange factor SIL1 n=1 Tax=Aquatica leii TaxID=1421715 RepID=A0AAN7SEL9_9COLE|nr:hypothetical protein RN001_011551 [Aquatica leii]
MVMIKNKNMDLEDGNDKWQMKRSILTDGTSDNNQIVDFDVNLPNTSFSLDSNQNLIIFDFSELQCNRNETPEENEKDLFVATHEWQVVKKGQKIPKGLHVRINFETGITEAKILDENELSSKNTAIVAESTTDETTEVKFSEAELKEALKNIKNDDVTSEHAEKIRTKFKSYEELKKDLNSININPKTANEILIERIQQHKDISKRPANEEYILMILQDLEFLVHQIDNANDFVTLNGFQEVIYPNLNSSNAKIKESSLNLLGSCMQNNPKVQIYGLETGAVGILLKVLALNSDYNVKNRAVFALGSLLRHFPLAQLRFVENAGLNVFGSLLEKSNNLRIQLKIVTLVNDLILEHESAVRNLKSIHYLEKVQQYNQVNLSNKLQSQNWCAYLAKLLVNVVNVDVHDHDAIEKALTALLSFNACKAEDKSSLVKILLRLKLQYANLSASVQLDDDNYFKELLNLCDKVLRLLNYDVKTEL